MVEKISFTPEEVRGYGNIVSVHSLDDYECYDGVLAETTDTIDGATVTVYEMEYQADTEATTISMTASSQSFVVGGSVTFTATLLDNELSGVSGVTITFKDGTTTLGTGTTNSSGVATYTTSSLASGSHSITAVFAGNSSYTASTSSAVSVTVLAHSYNLTFSASEYASTGGSASVTCTLTDNSVAVSGATVTFTGGTSTVTGTTDSDGDVTVTVSVSQTSTITATYGTTTATCTVTVPSYLFFDDATSDHSSWYTKANTNCTFTYNNNGYYSLIRGSSSTTSGVKINTTTFPKNVKITVDVQMRTSGNTQPKLVFISNNQTYGYVSRLTYTNKRASIIKGNFSGESSGLTESSFTQSLNVWYTFEFLCENNSLTFNIYDSGGTLKKTLTATGNITFSDSNNVVGMAIDANANVEYWFRNLKVEAL